MIHNRPGRCLRKPACLNASLLSLRGATEAGEVQGGEAVGPHAMKPFRCVAKSCPLRLSTLPFSDYALPSSSLQRHAQLRPNPIGLLHLCGIPGAILGGHLLLARAPRDAREVRRKVLAPRSRATREAMRRARAEVGELGHAVQSHRHGAGADCGGRCEARVGVSWMKSEDRECNAPTASVLMRRMANSPPPPADRAA